MVDRLKQFLRKNYRLGFLGRWRKAKEIRREAGEQGIEEQSVIASLSIVGTPTLDNLVSSLVRTAEYYQQYGNQVAQVAQYARDEDIHKMRGFIPTDAFVSGYNLITKYGPDMEELLELAKNKLGDTKQLIAILRSQERVDIAGLGLAAQSDYLPLLEAAALTLIPIGKRIELEKRAREQKETVQKVFRYSGIDEAHYYRFIDAVKKAALDCGISYLGINQQNRVIVVEAVPVRIGMYFEVLERALKAEGLPDNVKISEADLKQKVNLPKIQR